MLDLGQTEVTVQRLFHCLFMQLILLQDRRDHSTAARAQGGAGQRGSTRASSMFATGAINDEDVFQQNPGSAGGSARPQEEPSWEDGEAQGEWQNVPSHRPSAGRPHTGRHSGAGGWHGGQPQDGGDKKKAVTPCMACNAKHDGSRGVNCENWVQFMNVMDQYGCPSAFAASLARSNNKMAHRGLNDIYLSQSCPACDGDHYVVNCPLLDPLDPATKDLFVNRFILAFRVLAKATRDLPARERGWKADRFQTGGGNRPRGGGVGGKGGKGGKLSPKASKILTLSTDFHGLVAQTVEAAEQAEQTTLRLSRLPKADRAPGIPAPSVRSQGRPASGRRQARAEQSRASFTTTVSGGAGSNFGRSGDGPSNGSHQSSNLAIRDSPSAQDKLSAQDMKYFDANGKEVDETVMGSGGATPWHGEAKGDEEDSAWEGRDGFGTVIRGGPPSTRTDELLQSVLAVGESMNDRSAKRAIDKLVDMFGTEAVEQMEPSTLSMCIQSAMAARM